jgi:oxygen-independent coproporphyrinogen-3 oxidase
VNVDLIYGLPQQSIDSFNRTLDAVIDLSPDRLSVFNYAHLPQRFKPQRRINEADLPTVNDKLAILQNTIQTLTDAGYVYVGMDHFAKPDDELVKAQQTGGLHRNFQGYTTHGECDLIGMGVSSIGKVCDVYSQNAKDLESYYKDIDVGRLPVIKGIQLNFDDQLRREVIQRLICDFELDFSVIERGFRISFRRYFSEELELFESMERDGLIALDAGSIRVLAAGRLLVRNVCMVFDVSLRKQTGEQRFSRVI